MAMRPFAKGAAMNRVRQMWPCQEDPHFTVCLQGAGSTACKDKDGEARDASAPGLACETYNARSWSSNSHFIVCITSLKPQ